MQVKEYVSRICWNSQGWRFPTGEVRELESNSHQAETGFGYEEWLFDFARLVDGWRYALVQGVNDSRRRLLRDNEKYIDLRLFTQTGPGRRNWVARIAHCEILDDAGIRTAAQKYRELGYLRDMDHDLRRLDVERKHWPSRIQPDWMISFRFRPSDVEMYRPPHGISADAELKGKGFDRYLLRPTDNLEVVKKASKLQRGRRGTMVDLSTISPFVPARPATQMDRVHARMQNEIKALLQRTHGNNAVIAEEDFVDLKVRGKHATWLEIKNAPSIQAVREGLGQLLAYVYCRGETSAKLPSLLVVGTTAACAKTRELLYHLRKRHQLVIDYVPFQLGQTEFKLPGATS